LALVRYVLLRGRLGKLGLFPYLRIREEQKSSSRPKLIASKSSDFSKWSAPTGRSAAPQEQQGRNQSTGDKIASGTNSLRSATVQGAPILQTARRLP
jgi:hypothetical protein